MFYILELKMKVLKGFSIGVVVGIIVFFVFVSFFVVVVVIFKCWKILYYRGDKFMMSKLIWFFDFKMRVVLFFGKELKIEFLEEEDIDL